jgi:hypothetical protein
MDDRQQAKQVVLDYFADLEAAAPNDIAAVLERHVTDDYCLRAVHPFNVIESAADVANSVWAPLATSFTSLQRRQDIFMAGPNLIAGDMWVTSMGTFLGLFDRPWLGIRPTRKIALLPYCEFHRVADGRITESALWVDVVSIMKQSGYNPFGPQTGAEIVNPGPRTADGVLLEAQDEAESQKTLDLIMQMCNELVGDGMESPDDSLRNTWHEDMLWFGPSGIGATFTIERYQKQHQGPFNAGLKKATMAAGSAGPTCACSRAKGSWGYPRRTSAPKCASSISIDVMATSWRRTGYSSISCIT